MRVAYLVHFRGGRETGIFRKVQEHVTEWSRRGHDVGLFVATDLAGRDDWAAIPETQSIRLLPDRSALSWMTRERIAADLRRWAPEVAYARHGLAYPGFVLVARSVPTVVEVNANDVAEFQSVSAWRHALARVTRSMLLSQVAGLVFVTSELSSADAFTRFAKPGIVVSNGIDLRVHTPLPAPANDRPHLLFVGHRASPWHGLDHVVELATAFHEWHFDIVGPPRDEAPGAGPNVEFHGTLSPEELTPILARADVAIGTLALYRNRMSEASPLKVREYLARGIPTIVGYRDTDFPEPAPYILEIPNRADGVTGAHTQIGDFVRRMIGTRVPADAVRHLDLAAKESLRLGALERVAKA